MSPLRFWLNDRPVEIAAAAPQDMLLDLLRLDHGLTGTKEGCAEGDCGACTVLVGRPAAGGMRYQAVNACIRPVAACHGCHVVTVEHLRGAGGGLHPVQQAMVDHHASQCGFCTPGIVMALAGLWLDRPAPSGAEVETALQGNLCRCTGYAPILRAAQAVEGAPADDPLRTGAPEMAAALAAIPPGAEVTRGGDRALVPADTDALAAALVENPGATLIAGATDVGLWVTKQLRPVSPAIFVGHLMQDIDVTETELRIGAGVTYTDFARLADAHLPQIAPYLHRIGGGQVRNAGTIGGNIANGSPIGEMPPLLIALGATIVLRRGGARREIPLEAFFLDYGRQDRAPDEFLETIRIPRPTGARIAAYKVSKRREADISAVSMGLWLVEADGRITDARLAFGGMAGTPRRAPGAEAALRGQPFAAQTFEAAAQAVAGDFTPLSDWRASAAYRQAVAGNLIRRFWLEQTGVSAQLSGAAEGGR